MTTPSIRKNEHIPELQLVRALAILGVLTVHASAAASISMLNSGYYFFYNFINIFMKFGTPTFILLSSFVLFYSYYNRPINGKLLLSFYKKRILYIIIPYIVFSVIYYALSQYNIGKPLLSPETWNGFFNLLMAGKAYSHLYFVFISIQFYLLFPLILWLTKKKPIFVHFLIPFGFIIQWAFVFMNLYDWHVKNKGSWSLSYFSLFFLGAALGIYYPKIKEWIIISKQHATGYRVAAWIALWISWLIVGISHVTIYFNARSHGTKYDPLLYEFLWAFHAVLSALVLIQAAFIIYRYLPAFISKPLYRLGQFSFGIYLVHLIFLNFYDKYIPGYGISWMAHFRFLGSWIFMLGGSWLVVSIAARFIPFSWLLFGSLPKHDNNANINKRSVVVVSSAVLLITASAAIGLWVKSNETVNKNERQPLAVVESIETTNTNYDVIVAGTDPEGIAAAVSAARNGLQVLLVDGRNREILGGLMTIGELNSLDLNYSPKKTNASGNHLFLNEGLFREWYDQVEGTSFDTNTAANAFYKMVKNEPNIDLLMKVQKMEPITEAGTSGNTAVTGLRIVKEDGSEINVLSHAVIDATQDGDIAAAAGAPFTIGLEDINDPEAQMAVTLVFKMGGVTQKIWNSFAGHKGSGIDATSAWGFGDAKDYVSSNPERVKIRGLNIGRQNDETILINAMHIFKVDPLDPKSVEEALEIGRAEAPRIVEYLKKNFKELKDLKFAGTADELYVRESRHFQGEYRLTLADLLNNRDHWDAIAYGSYNVDIQSTKHTDNGKIMMAPIQYGVPFRTLVPLKVDGLLVVGRAASFDSVPHGSARVIPLGMATAEAAGIAVKMTMENNITLRDLSKSEELIASLRTRLTEQGVDLTMNTFEAPYYVKHKDYEGLVAAASMMLTSGGEHNKDFDLDGTSNFQRFVYSMNKVQKTHPDFFFGDPNEAIKGVSNPTKTPLTLEQAIKTIAYTIDVKKANELTLEEMLNRNWIKQETIDGITDQSKLTNGDAFMIIRDVVEYYVGRVYK